MSKKVLIMAGGTGGHIFPGLSVAKALIEKGIDVQWLGANDKMERQLVPKHGIVFNGINVSGVRGKGKLALLKAPLMLLKAIIEARKVVKSYNPDLVIGFGGFTAGPGGLAAKLLGKPLFIHEQNSVAGLTNTSLAKIANKVLLAFDGAIKGSHVEWVGNPSRKEIIELNSQVKQFKQPSELLVLGGSLGAKALNQGLPELLAPYSQQIVITHQVGKGGVEACKAAYEQAGVEANVVEFIDDMAAAYGQADMMVCRSGASTVTEVALANIPALFVPFPFAVDDHQTHNAQFLVDAGGALLLQESDLSKANFEPLFEQLLDKQRWAEMSQSQQAMGEKLKHATSVIVQRIEETFDGS